MNTAKISHIKTDTNMMLPKQSFMKLAGWALACSAFFACAPEEVPRASLIPMPAHVEWLGGSLRVDSLSLFGADPAGSLRCVVDASADYGSEGYELRVTDRGVELRAATESGLFYGKQTLRQLYTPEGIPCVTITDAPRFRYRGLHLDVSRHFFPKEEVMKLLDIWSVKGSWARSFSGCSGTAA